MRDEGRQTTPVLEAPGMAGDRPYRVGPDLYQGLVDRGLISESEVGLVDGLLVRRDAGLVDGLYRMPLEIYDKVAEVGLLGPSDKVELLDGLLVHKMTKLDPHILATYQTWDALRAVLPGGLLVLKEDPVALPTGPSGYASEPEPDVMVIRGTLRAYLAGKRDPADVALVVEVSESSLREDRAKLARYGWAGIPVAWVVDLTERTVEVSTKPSGAVGTGGYEEFKVHGEDDTLAVVIDGTEVGRVAVRDLLP